MRNREIEDDSSAFDGKLAFPELVQAARQGDSDVLGALIEQYREYLTVIAKYDVERDLQAKMGASDFIQQTVLEAYQHFDQFRGQTPEEFKGWLRQILANEFSRARKLYFKAQRRQVSREHRLNDSQIAQPAIPDKSNITPSTDALVREQSRALEDMMARLPEHYQQIIRLRDWEEQTFPEIGRQMNISQEAARKLWRRAIIKLEALLQPMMNPDGMGRESPQGEASNAKRS